MAGLKALGLVLVLGCLAVSAEDQEANKADVTPRVMSEQDVRLLLNPFISQILATKGQRPPSHRDPYHQPYHYPPYYYPPYYYPHPYPPHYNHTYPPTPTTPMPPTTPTDPPTKPTKPTPPTLPPGHPPLYPHHPYYPPYIPPNSFYPQYPRHPPIIVIVSPPTPAPGAGTGNGPNTGTGTGNGPNTGTGNGDNNTGAGNGANTGTGNGGNNAGAGNGANTGAGAGTGPDIRYQWYPRPQTEKVEEEPQYDYVDMYARNMKDDVVSIVASNSDEETEKDSFIVDTKDIKLPFGITINSSSGTSTDKKNKEQEALIYLRNYKRGRQLFDSQTA